MAACLLPLLLSCFQPMYFTLLVSLLYRWFSCCITMRFFLSKRDYMGVRLIIIHSYLRVIRYKLLSHVIYSHITLFSLTCFQTFVKIFSSRNLLSKHLLKDGVGGCEATSYLNFGLTNLFSCGNKCHTIALRCLCNCNCDTMHTHFLLRPTRNVSLPHVLGCERDLGSSNLPKRSAKMSGVKLIVRTHTLKTLCLKKNVSCDMEKQQKKS